MPPASSVATEISSPHSRGCSPLDATDGHLPSVPVPLCRPGPCMAQSCCAAGGCRGCSWLLTGLLSTLALPSPPAFLFPVPGQTSCACFCLAGQGLKGLNQHLGQPFPSQCWQSPWGQHPLGSLEKKWVEEGPYLTGLSWGPRVPGSQGPKVLESRHL